MDSPNISELNFEQSGSRLLSESSLLPSSSSSLSRTGPGGDDLSLSELSLSERPQPAPSRRPKFSLLAQPLPQKDSLHQDESAIAEEDAETEDAGLDHTMTQEDVEKARKLAVRTREEKLQHDLFILKKLNSAFEVYKEALKEAKSSTERVAEQLKHTDALLDKYVNILSKTEDAARLIMDDRWQGAEADEDFLEREYQEKLERARREEEERMLAAERERERLEREEQERKEAEDRTRLERERAEAAKAVGRGSGVRGVRGTRASMRGMKGVARAVPTATASTRGTRGTTSTTGLRRPTTSTRPIGSTTRGVPASKRS
ncbi:DASH complex subunit Duo1-domain-containing protein [Rhodofomes roseus]|uniref:DASH complex subunit DUO1 n=1 Tax=Rhodofomes roseus TaxID=34475 RepID=A0ABQ8KMN7_9APHY|nr:DASH complex subunit Duo1-domain-containing protein [Rhodofomes roseus]KAH9839471.1 DASH complex subunit Duo1-domain-containing protein [Rhodofomes roseus]